MEFDVLLKEYMEQLSCSVKELSEASGLSAAVISRYRNGERKPGIDSEQLQTLVNGLATVAIAKGKTELTMETILASLQNSLNKEVIDYENFTKNFDTLIDMLQISMKKVSQATNFDTSYLYRVRSGQRHPNDLNAFVENFCHYVVSNYNSDSDRSKVASLISCEATALERSSDYLNLVKDWLYHTSGEDTGHYMQSFLQKLDEFDLDEYIRAIHFDTLKVPTMPIHLPTSKHYYGVEQMRKAELNFFKETVLSRTSEPIFMCSDMPMGDMAENMDFNKKWMFGIAASLKKGLHLDIIHNIDRPFHEMMLGLEAWIPIYMTGQISPYHLPNISTNIYHHLNYVSGVAALTGECINGHHDNGKYYLTNNKEEVAYFQTKAKDLLTKAQPLMNIFREYSKQSFHDYETMEANEIGNRHNIWSSLPIYTISDTLLDKILNRADISAEQKQELVDYATEKKKQTLKILEKNEIFDEVPTFSKEEFEAHPAHVCLSGAFLQKEIPYTYEEYMEHLELTREFAEKTANYTLSTKADLAFRNIQIQILENKSVMLSKEKAPTIHFVIKHPKMVNALSNFIPIVQEK